MGLIQNAYRRTPRWVRGLKYEYMTGMRVRYRSRTPRWVRGLKYVNMGRCFVHVNSRTPRWVRGLKSFGVFTEIFRHYVAPHDGCVD